MSHKLVEKLDKAYLDAASLLAAAEQDILAYKSFPKEHWRRIHSTNLLERVNKEVKRRTQVVGIFPNQASCLYLISAFLMEYDQPGKREEFI